MLNFCWCEPAKFEFTRIKKIALKNLVDNKLLKSNDRLEIIFHSNVTVIQIYSVFTYE